MTIFLQEHGESFYLNKTNYINIIMWLRSRICDTTLIKLTKPYLFNFRRTVGTWYLLIYLSMFFDQEMAKSLFRSSSQAAICYYQSNDSKVEAVPPGFDFLASRTKLHQRLAVSTWWCGPSPFYKRLTEMARQLSREIRPFGHPISSGIFYLYFFV